MHPSPPVITTHPEDRIANVGDRVTFKVGASGTPPISYQWWKDGAAIPGATNTLFEIKAVQAFDAGFYRAVAANTSGAVTSGVAMLVVNGATRLLLELTVPGTANPWLAGAPPGTPASFTDSAPAQSPAELRNIEADRYYSLTVTGGVARGYGWDLAPPDGIPSELTRHAAGYQNGIGDIYAPYGALVGVFLGAEAPDPASPEPPVLDYAVAGLDWDEVTPQLRQPFFIGDGLNKRGQQRIRAPKGASRLFLGPMDSYEWANNPGSFLVRIYGNGPAPITPPLFIRQPVDLFVREGETAQFEAVVQGSPPLTFAWRHHDVPIPGATNAILRISPVTAADAGSYAVEVSNPGATVVSATVFLRLDTSDPRDVNAALGKPVTLDGPAASWSGTPPDSLVDGAFLPQGTGWTSGTVYWTRFEGQDNRIVIDLQGTFFLESLVVQADDNDGYLIESLDPDRGVWETAWAVPNYNLVDGADVYGMQTRPDPHDNRVRYFLPAPLRTAKLRLGADPLDGDGSYSVSEIQAWGYPESTGGVPPRIATEPSDLECPAGGTAFLRVDATGSAPLGYRWQRGTLPLGGGTGPELILTNATPDLAGGYSVVVFNSIGTVTSRVAQLTVNTQWLVRYVTNSVVAEVFAGPATFLEKSYRDGVGPEARFARPNGGFVDVAGRIHVADTSNQRIRRIDPDARVTTVAGSGALGFADGPALAAEFRDPLGVSVDAAGNLHVADAGNHRIRRVDPQGWVSTLAGTGAAGYQDGPGLTALLNTPNDLVSDAAGNLFITEFGNHTVRRLDADGTVSTWVGNGTPGSADGFRTDARLDQPGGLAIDPDGNLYIAEWRGGRVRRVGLDGIVRTIAGSAGSGWADGPGTEARFEGLDGIAVDGRGFLFVAENEGSRIRRIRPDGVVETVLGGSRAGSAGGIGVPVSVRRPVGLGLDPGGALYVVSEQEHRVHRVAFDPLPLRILRQPESLTVPEGARVDISVAATGTGPVAYQWYFESRPIPGALASNLVIATASPTNAGRYAVQLRNPVGTVWSDEATLGVVPRPETALFNGDFESPILAGMTWSLLSQDEVPGWKTTSPDGLIELWVGERMDTPSFHGLQHAEINAVYQAALYQDIRGLADGLQCGFEFAHRGRWATNELDVVITDLGPDQREGGGDDMPIFRRSYATGPDAWVQYDSRLEPPVFSRGRPLRIAFESRIEGSIGNLLDDVRFGPGVAGTPPTNSPPVILGQPEDGELALGETAVLRVVASGGVPRTYFWSRTEGPLPGGDETSATLVLSNAGPATAGHYRVIVSNPFGAVTSRVAAVSVATTPRPILLSASTPRDPTRVTLVFSRALDPESATNPENYRYPDGIPVTRAELVAADTVLLHTALERPGWYQAGVSHVRAAEPGGATVARDSRALFALTDGLANWSLFDRIPAGTSLDAALADHRVTSGWPSRHGLATAFEFPTDDHGAQLLGQLRALLSPPVSGNYRFWLWGDDAARLYLGTGADPRSKRLIASLDMPAPFRSYPVASDPIPLEAGHRYYLEAVFLESDDLDGVGVAWQPPGAPAPAPGDPPIPGEFLTSMGSIGRPVLRRAATELEVDAGQPPPLAWAPSDIAGTPPIACQWLRKGLPIPGATNSFLEIPWLEPGDAGAGIALRLTNAYGTVQAPLALLTVRPDPRPPSVEWVEGSPYRDGILVRFSEAVTEDSASNPGNYTLTGGPTLRSAARQADGRSVFLATSGQAFGATYELTVRNVVDVEGHPMAGEHRIGFPDFVEQTGVVARERWLAARIGRHLETLLDLPAFQAGTPSTRQPWPGAELAPGPDAHAGERLWGWIVPPESGEYRFALAADDAAALLLSDTERPDRLERVASLSQPSGFRDWGREPSQVSAPRLLEAGRAYAFEVVKVNGTGEAHLTLGWQRPGAPAPEAIDPASLRLRLDPRSLGPTLLEQPVSVAAWQQAGAAFRVRAVAGAFALGPLAFQWQRNGADIPGATANTHLTPLPLDPTIDSGARFQCRVTDAAGTPVLSTEATLTVLPQSEPAPLVLRLNGTLLEVEWPGAPGVRLQQATRLDRPDWTDVPGSDGASRAELPAASARTWFRLVRNP